jgi:hypothetical protein
MSLEEDIRDWYGNSGSTINKDEIISVLLQLLFRIEVLEAKLEKESTWKPTTSG